MCRLRVQRHISAGSFLPRLYLRLCLHLCLHLLHTLMTACIGDSVLVHLSSTCRRVFTTSNGHVITAPTVPLTL